MEDVVDKDIAVKVLKECLDINEKDEVLIISDVGRNSALLGDGFEAGARSLGNVVKRLVQEPQTELSKASDEVIEALRNLADGNIVVLAISNKLGSMKALGKSFRRFCQFHKHRFISTTGLHSLANEKFADLVRAIDVDYTRMQLYGLLLKKKFDNASQVRVVSDAGTDIVFDIFGMQAICNAGNYRQPGSGGNIPAGEVYLAPRGVSNVRGTFVIDGSLRTDERTYLIEEPVTVTVKNGRVVSMEGKQARLLEDALVRAEKRAKYPERIRIIGELGFGINSSAVIGGATILDEKVVKSAHIAIGSNYWFGGANKTLFHADQVMKSVRIFVDGEEVKIV
jgi:aminopeptidase